MLAAGCSGHTARSTPLRWRHLSTSMSICHRRLRVLRLMEKEQVVAGGVHRERLLIHPLPDRPYEPPLIAAPTFHPHLPHFCRKYIQLIMEIRTVRITYPKGKGGEGYFYSMGGAVARGSNMEAVRHQLVNGLADCVKHRLGMVR